MAANSVELFQLVRSENIERLRQLLQQVPRVNVNIANEVGQTPLYWACELPRPDVARLLIQAGADLNQTEQHGFTPLHLAAFIGNEEIVQLLLDSGALCNKRNNTGSTPLHLACKNSHASVIVRLLRAGADKNLRDDKGNLPIDYCKNPEVRSLLISTQPAPSAVSMSAPTSSSSTTMSSGRAPGDRKVSTPAMPSSSALPAQTSTSHANAGNAYSGTSNSASAASAAAPANAEKQKAASSAEKIAQLQKTIATTQDINVLRKIATVLSESVLSEQKKVSGAQEKLQAERAKSLCFKCQQEPRDTVLVPCMHLLYCSRCALQMSQCLACAQPVEGRFRCELTAPAK